MKLYRVIHAPKDVSLVAIAWASTKPEASKLAASFLIKHGAGLQDTEPEIQCFDVDPSSKGLVRFLNMIGGSKQ